MKKSTAYFCRRPKGGAALNRPPGCDKIKA